MSSSENYKAKLMKALQLKSRGGLAIYEMTKLAVEIFDDADFRFDHANADDFRCADILDEQLFADFGWTFFDLRRMLTHFPQQCDWKAGTLRKLHEQALEKTSADMEATPRKPAQRATIKEVGELKDTVKTLEVQHKFDTERIRENIKTIDELLEENAALKRRVAHLEGRIEELTRQLAAV